MTAGLYIHIPFCDIKCGYCDFYTVTRRSSLIPAYLKALKKEINSYAEDSTVSDLQFGSIFFGGGTPSLLSIEELSSLLGLVRTNFSVVDEPEVTLETNPGTVDLDKLRGLLKAGINRLSLGVQSFDSAELRFLDRDHSAEQSASVLSQARQAGFANISVDLIFGLPDQRPDAWKNNLQKAVDLNPNHISAYNLTYEKGTRLTKRFQRGDIGMLADEMQREMHLATIDFLDKNGYRQYEISNYAKPGFQSIHNQKYWNGSPYLGLGVSSHSFLNGRRFWNVRNIRIYVATLTMDHKLPLAGEEGLDLNQKALEKIYLGLRQRQGLSLNSFRKEIGLSLFERYPKQLSKFFDCSFENGALISELTRGEKSLKKELMKIEAGALRLTREGIVLCDAICAEFA